MSKVRHAKKKQYSFVLAKVKMEDLLFEETSTQLNNINKFDVKSHQIDR